MTQPPGHVSLTMDDTADETEFVPPSQPGATPSTPLAPLANQDELVDLRNRVVQLQAAMDQGRARSRGRRPASESPPPQQGLFRGNTPTHGPTRDDDSDAADPPLEPATRLQLMQVEKMMKPREPGEFSGGNIAATKEFIRGCDGVFKIQRHIYYTSYDRYSYAVTRLRGTVANNWESHNRTEGSSVERWGYLQSWLLDLVQDPMNRSISYALRLFTCTQKPHQRVADYATYLENIEREVEMEPLTDKQRGFLLIATLVPSLRNELLRQHEVPLSRKTLIPLLSRLEQTTRQIHSSNNPTSESSSTRKKDADTSHKGSTSQDQTRRPWKSKSKDQGQNRRNAGYSQANTTPIGRVEEVKDQGDTNKCYNCGQAGHWAKNCPKSKKGKS